MAKPNAATYAREAVRMALVNLSAIAAPAGHNACSFRRRMARCLLHEAIWTWFRRWDFNRRQTSVFSGRIGDKGNF